MKTNSTTKQIVTGLCALLGAVGSASAETWWYSDGANNSTAATGTAADNYVDMGSSWKDTYIKANSASTNFGASATIASNFEGTLPGLDQAMMFIGWDGLSISDPLTSASYYFTGATSTPNGETNTWYLVGINGAWTEATTWGTTGVSGGNTQIDRVNWATTNYGSFTATGPWTVGQFYSFDVTDALQDYLAGNITGFAIINNSGAGQASGAGRVISINTVEQSNLDLRPGLLVTTTPIPEPSAALLGLLGTLGLVLRRRR